MSGAVSKLALRFRVSVDFLLGLSPVEESDRLRRMLTVEKRLAALLKAASE